VLGGVYLIQQDGRLVEMSEQAYDSEDLLQDLLAQYPNLLAGDRTDGGEPRRWLLISREMPLASKEERGGRWSVDHLFLDQEAVPTIVEVKRSTDTRIRREVVGQMLDYAANAIVYWPVEALRARFGAACERRGVDPEAVLEESLSVDSDQDVFWQQAKTNLQAGKVRLVFVADEIPPELRRIVEFLNEQMDPAEVLAVEIKQYTGQGMKTLVPRLVGQTVGAQQKKSGGASERSQWNEPSFFGELERRQGVEVTAVARRILEGAQRRATYVWWGQGKTDGSFVPTLIHGRTKHQLLAVWTYGVVEIYFQYSAYKPPFDLEQKRRELLERLNSIPGVSIPKDAIARRPTIPLSTLEDEAALRLYLETYEWVIEQIKGS
jgi:hypothetical protein